MKLIEAKIALIIDSSRVAINAGESAGVEVGSPVTLWHTVTVKDPDTEAMLGNVRIDAMALEVVSVEEKVCVARPKSTSNLFFNFATSRPRIRDGDLFESTSSHNSNEVVLQIGDEVTIQIPEDDK